jgi:molybdenum cofactor cytidylyltransferase
VIPGVILAAGRSTRMGRSKALLPFPPTGRTFVAQLAATLLAGGAADALIVGRPHDDALRREVDRLPAGVRFIENPNADSGQLSSLIAGVNAADRPGTRAILVTPVDLPLITPATIAALLAAFARATEPIVRATHAGRHGHPVVFGRAVFDSLRGGDPRIGAKAILRSHPVLDVEVNDPGVLTDVDTPADYDRVLRSGDVDPPG